MRPPPRWLLPLLVASQFAGTSLWFAGNAVLPDVTQAWALSPWISGLITSSVQLGFILGTLLSAGFALPERVAPRRLFFLCALCGALCNLTPLILPGAGALLLSRALTGLCLAGIYPVGMKIAASWYEDGLGRALGYLVGALVLGTALPHGIRAAGAGLPWQWVLVAVSAVALLGGASVLVLVPNRAPSHKRATPEVSEAGSLRAIFARPRFRAAVAGYVGHMWELYAFWAALPLIMAWRLGAQDPARVSLGSFGLIAVGALGCVTGGWWSRRASSARVAQRALMTSGLCALSAPLLMLAPDVVFWPVMVLWSVCVIADSPQFSALTAHTAPTQWVGSALTVSTCLGFAITIASIELLSVLSRLVELRWALPLLALGPVAGLWAMRPLLQQDAPGHAA